MRAMARLGLLGGTFDPVHIGHLVLARELAEELGLDEVRFLPARTPPHKPAASTTPVADRVGMLRLALAEEPGFRVDLRELRREGPSYTYDTLRELREEGPGELFFLLGADSLVELPTWYRAAELLELARFVTAVRPGFTPEPAELRRVFSPTQVERLLRDLIPTTPIGVSSSLIREKVRCGRSIRHLVPPAVEGFIRRRGLYQGVDTAGGGT